MVRTALVLIVVFAIAYVLVTPDPTDDVDGILQPNHLSKAHTLTVVSVSQSQILITVALRSFAIPAFVPRLNTWELLDLACVYRC